MLQMDDDDGRPPIRLPKELLLFIVRSLDDRDCVALALSGAFVGFASLYDAVRNKGAAISLSYRHHFLSNQNHWERFLNQNGCFPSSITVFDVTNCYWLLAQQICVAVVQLDNLEQLNVNGTKVGLQNLAQIFTVCKKITKLNFKFVEKSWDQVVGALRGKEKVIIESFQKLTFLKISTWCLDARDYLNDPWVLIIRFLSWCRDCVGLAVEITYMGDDFTRQPLLALNSAEEEVQRMLKTDVFPKLDWITNLKKLVLIKYGDFHNNLTGDNGAHSSAVQSLLLDDLCAFVFQEERAPSSLECVWVQDLHLATSLLSHWRNSTMKKTYFDTQHKIDFSDEGIYQLVLQEETIEHLGGIGEFSTPMQREEHPGPYLPNIKYCHVSPHDGEEVDQQRLNDFIREHPSLEQLSMEDAEEYEPMEHLKLPKLKKLSVGWDSTITSKKRMDILAKSCPNIEALRLFFWEVDEDDDIPGVPSDVCLSTFSFKKLTLLSLSGEFQLHDGAFMPSVIRECPHLQSLLLEGTLEPDSFLPNFNQFLSLASNLRNLRLTFISQWNDSVILLLLGSIFKARPNLERLALIGKIPYDGPAEKDPSCCSMWNHPPDLEDFLIKFATNMKRLVFCCINFYCLDAAVSSKINRLIAEKVVQFRPSLWFHVGNFIPYEDPDLPLIHYLDMLVDDYYVPPSPIF